jgi:putative glutathione S-transferase
MSENKDIVFKDLADSNGEFKRKVSSFRDQIEDDPDAKFPAEVNRYHLYVCTASFFNMQWSPGCPWANRAAIVRTLKGLEDVISIRYFTTNII